MPANYRGWASKSQLGHVLLALALLALGAGALGAEPPASTRMTHLVGTVLDADGKPAAKADVGIVIDDLLAWDKSGRPMWHTKADAAGRFDLEVPSALRTAKVVARRAGSLAATSARLTLSGSRQQLPALKLGPGLKLAGRVVDERRQPIAGVAIEAVSHSFRADTIPSEVLRARATSGRDGGFELAGLDAGRYNLKALSRNHAVWTRSAYELDTSPASRRLEIAMQAGVFFAGTIVDADGRALAGASISDTDESSPLIVSSDARGGFRIGPFEASVVRDIEFGLEGYTPFRERSAPRDGLVVVLNRKAALRGRVVDAATNQPVASFQVSIHSPKVDSDRVDRNQLGPRRKFDSREGRFELADVSSGPWTVSVLASGYQPWHSKDFEFQGGVTHDLVIALERGLAVRGRIIDKVSGKPLPGALVSFEAGERHGYLSDVKLGAGPPPQPSDARGEFELLGVPAGSVMIRARADGYQDTVQRVSTETQAFVELAAVRAAMISGRVVAADGVTPLKAMVKLARENGSTGHFTGEQGRFEFSKQRPGTYRVEAETDAGRSESQEITVAEGEVRSGLVLRVVQGASVRGRLSGLPAAELAQVEVKASDSPLDRSKDTSFAPYFGRGGSVDSNGAYRIQGLPGGHTRIGVTARYGGIAKRIKVPPRGEATLDFDFADVRISGQVTRNGRPVGGVSVHVEPLEGQLVTAFATTTPSGSYALSELEPGRYAVITGNAKSVEINVRDAVVHDFELAPFDIAGRAVDAVTGQGLGGVTFELVSLGDSGADRKYGGMGPKTDGQGAFSIAELEKGDYLLMLHRAGYDIAEQRISLSASVADLSVAMRPAAGVALRVRSPRDVSVGSVYVAQQSGIAFLVTLDAAGAGQLPPALAGRALQILAYGCAPFLIERWNGAPLEVELQKQPEGR